MANNGYICCCPSHKDRRPSLRVSNRDGKVLVKCFAGCTQTAVVDALKARGLWLSACDRHRYSASERREYSRNIDRARAAAEVVIDWRDSYLGDLRVASQLLLARYHELSRESDEEGDSAKKAAAESCFEKLDDIAARRDLLAAATGPELVAFFASFRGEAL